MTTQEIAVGVSLLSLAGAGINVFVGLRLAVLQARVKADAVIQEIALVKQFVAWKDEILTAINGKYVSERLITEIRGGLTHEMGVLTHRLDLIDERCEKRHARCLPDQE